jgi:hypothetical protein
MSYVIQLRLLEHSRVKDEYSIDVDTFDDAYLAFEVTRDNGLRYIPQILKEHKHGKISHD